MAPQPPRLSPSPERGEALVMGLIMMALLGGVLLAALLLYRETDLTRAVLPAFIAFGLQSAFILALARIQARHHRLAERREVKRTLRTQLLAHIHWCISDGQSVRATDHFLADRHGLDNLINTLRGNALTPETVSRFRQFAEREGRVLESLAGAAARIDFDHLDAWSSLLRGLPALAREETNKTVLEFLEAVRRFDRLEVV